MSWTVYLSVGCNFTTAGLLKFRHMEPIFKFPNTSFQIQILIELKGLFATHITWILIWHRVRVRSRLKNFSKFDFPKNLIFRKTWFLEKLNFPKNRLPGKFDCPKNSISQKARFPEKLDFPKKLIPRKTWFPEKLDPRKRFLTLSLMVELVKNPNVVLTSSGKRRFEQLKIF